MNLFFPRGSFLAPLLAALLIAPVGLAKPALAQESGSLFDDVELNPEHIAVGEEFVVPGEFSMATPTGGFAWQQLKNENGNAQQVPAKWYSCTKEGSAASIVVGIEMRTAESDPARLAAIAGHYNTLLVRLDQSGFTDPTAKKPSLETPVPNKVTYEVTAKTPSGVEIFMPGQTIFGGRVFSIQVAAESRDKADELLAVVDTFKDLSPPVAEVVRGETVGDEFTVAGHFAIAAPGNGYQWALAQTTQVKGVSVPTYTCSKKDEPSTIVLTVQEKPSGADASPDEQVRKHYETLLGQLKAAGYTDIHERAPDTKSADANRIAFAIRGKDPKGQVTYLFGLTVYGRNLYTLHLISPSQDEARILHKAVNSFKELPSA